jgi:hypothetical protein
MSKMKVMIGAKFRREAVLIDPNINAAEPTFNPENPGLVREEPNNVIATGETSRGILRKIYDR